MGVPAFFRWLSKKYPAIVAPADDGQPQNYEFDNLYLDMNGIIHPCTHPENKAPPENEDEMFEAIFEYIEKLMRLVRPKKLLYMAIDGVAPRAKMNQQRSRRFRAAKESSEKMIAIQKIKDELRAKGIDIAETDKKGFDSNVITPGTQFMVNLSAALRNWIDLKFSADNPDEDGIWPKDMIIILSDASVPGEGEHKIIDYIRKQKVKPDYNPNISHLLCGADADLIMLGLATHELKFTIIREEFIPNQPKPCEICGQIGHEMNECLGDIQDPNEEKQFNPDPGFIYIKLPVLREYLQKESKGLDLERFIDDFVFLCFFVGNDFLPHLPSLEIREGAIDRLLGIYNKMMADQTEKKEYLTEDGFVSMQNVQTILTQLGHLEDDIFKQRKRNDKKFKERIKRQKMFDERNKRNVIESAWMKPNEVEFGFKRTEGASTLREQATSLRMANLSSAQQLKAMLKDPNAEEKQPEQGHVEKRKHDSEDEDNVDLGSDGWKHRYYYNKFDCSINSKISRTVVKEYVKGFCWVLRYYYQGCPDWQWFYPFHYAPFASDFSNIEKIEVKFNRKARPFRPLEQLMSVFPAASSENLPITWRNMMFDIDSPIIDFYPNDFKIDLNGKRAAWMGVALLPFIDEIRMFNALKKVYPDLTPEEWERNSHGAHLLFVSLTNEEALEFTKNLKASGQTKPSLMNSSSFNGMFGRVRRSLKYSDLYRNSICLEYYDPIYPETFIFPAKRLKGAIEPPITLKPSDYSEASRGPWRPVIGLERSNQRATLGQAGHRMIGNSYMNRQMGPSYKRSSNNCEFNSNMIPLGNRPGPSNPDQPSFS